MCLMKRVAVVDYYFWHLKNVAGQGRVDGTREHLVELRSTGRQS